MYNIPKEQYDFIKMELVHKDYGKHAGLMIHEYDLVFADDMVNDIEIGSGKDKILISLKCHPLFHRERFLALLESIFKRTPINWTDFKGINKNVRKDDKEKYYALAISDVFAEVDNNSKKLPKFSTRYVTFLELVDHGTKKKVEVKVTGSAFDALPNALRLMYGRED